MNFTSYFLYPFLKVLSVRVWLQSLRSIYHVESPIDSACKTPWKATKTFVEFARVIHEERGSSTPMGRLHTVPRVEKFLSPIFSKFLMFFGYVSNFWVFFPAKSPWNLMSFYFLQQFSSNFDEILITGICGKFRNPVKIRTKCVFGTCTIRDPIWGLKFLYIEFHLGWANRKFIESHVLILCHEF